MNTDTWLQSCLPVLKRLNRLKSLKLNSCPTTSVTNDWLIGLGELTKLQKLDIAGCRNVTDVGFRELSALTDLRELNLSRTKITDEGVKHVCMLKQLRTLRLSDTGVTDAGLKKLAELKQLQTLDLSYSGWYREITDVGLAHIAGAIQLKQLNLHNTNVTRAGVANFKKLLSECEVHD
jgi:Leucine-rich repeat (LRR) protein